tara:strand:- start:2327 stop:2635 length:309 start_codon:yes stop_codon:yes gene_type:complete
LIEIFKNKPPKNLYILMKKYQNIEFRQKFSIKLIENYFKEYPEEKRGRKRFKQKEIQNIKHLIYEKILQKGIKVNADCIGSIKEKVEKELITIKVSFFKKNG